MYRIGNKVVALVTEDGDEGRQYNEVGRIVATGKSRRDGARVFQIQPEDDSPLWVREEAIIRKV